MVKVDDEGATRKDAARSNHGKPSVELVFCHSGPPLPQNVVSSFVQHSAVATMRRELLLRDALPDPGRGSKRPAQWHGRNRVQWRNVRTGNGGRIRGGHSRPPDLDRWTSVHPSASVVLPSSARTRKRENQSGGEACRYRGRRGQSQRERERGRRRPPCHALALEWTWSGH